MYPAPFEYYRPTSVADAIKLLQDHPGAKILAGGHSLLPAMKLRLAMPSALVDIGHIHGLSGSSVNGDGNVVVGAMMTHTHVVADDDVRRHCPVLGEAANMIGDQMVRNRGTIGGSLAHADPAADYPPVVVALGGKMTAMGPKGERTIEAKDFFVDLLTTALAPDEVLTSVTLKSYRGHGMSGGGSYVSHMNPASGYSVAGACAVVSIRDGKCDSATLVVGGVAANPLRCAAAEDRLRGATANAENVAAAAKEVAKALEGKLLMSDSYASGDYRAHLAHVTAQRALTNAIARAMA